MTGRLGATGVLGAEPCSIAVAILHPLHPHARKRSQFGFEDCCCDSQPFYTVCVFNWKSGTWCFEVRNWCWAIPNNPTGPTTGLSGSRAGDVFRGFAGQQERRDSNPQPVVLETTALPVELHSFLDC